MRIDIITLFPEICRAPLNESMMKRARENGALDLHIHNLRDWTSDRHHVVDDAPFGGGQGMVMKVEPVFKAVEELKEEMPKGPTPNVQRRKPKVILMSPAGQRLNQKAATQLSKESHLIIVCGHYEGVDHRVVEGSDTFEVKMVGRLVQYEQVGILYHHLADHTANFFTTT